MSDQKSPPSYHDLHVTTADIPRTSIFNLPYGYEVSCNRVGGWTSAEVVKAALGDALDAAPERLDDVVLTCAPWVERESRVDGSRRAERSYRELSPWLPTEAVVRAAAVQYPHVVATTSDYDDGVAEGTPQLEHHLSHILRLAT